MAVYYNAETLLEFVKQYTPRINGETTMECVETAILNAPTADVVEVVRCKDCVYRYSSEFCECRPGDAYCSDGDRFIKEEEK